MQRRHVWRIDKAGNLDRLRWVEEALPPPQPGQVTVRVEAVGLNFADVFACLGLYSATPRGSFVPGLEFAGRIEALASDAQVSPFAVGERVTGLTRFGGYATRLNVATDYLKRLPDDWTPAEGAAFGAQALTAWYAMYELGNLKPDQTVLIHSAAGGVGLHCVQLTLAAEAVPICTVGSLAKVGFLKQRFGLEPQQIIVRDARRFGKQLDAGLAGVQRDSCDLILDSLDGPFFWPGYRRLARGGRLVLFGAADLMPPGKRVNWPRLAVKYLRRPRLDPLEMIAENRSLMAFNLIWLWDRVDQLSRLYGEMGKVFRQPPHVGKTFPFDEAPQALRYLQSGRNIGKVVLLV